MNFVKKIVSSIRDLFSKKAESASQKNVAVASEEIETSGESKFLKVSKQVSAFLYSYLKRLLLFVLSLINTMMQPMIKISKKHPIAFWAAVILHASLLFGLLYANVEKWDTPQATAVSQAAPVQAVMIDMEIIEAEQDRLKDVEKQKQKKLKNEEKRSETAKKDQKVALVGPSGGGKTTVIKLLYRLFDIDEGKIIIDDQDISLVTQKSLRQSLSVVTQEPLLFDNTLYFNIAYANPTATKKQVWKAIRFAQLDKFIARLPYKENTVVGERGVKLSGGEKQRVSIARALLANKKILVLDEATSALDSETEKDIQKALVKLMNNRTSIIIAHRLSTIMKADIIVVMDKGKIVEVGSHKELANKRGGLYKRLWDLQQGGGLG